MYLSWKYRQFLPIKMHTMARENMDCNVGRIDSVLKRHSGSQSFFLYKNWFYSHPIIHYDKTIMDITLGQLWYAMQMCSISHKMFFVVFVLFNFICGFRSENHYETVGDSGSNYQMNTMDVRIKITNDIIKESDKFSDDSVDADEYKINTNNEKIFKSDLVSAARNFKKKCLARISSLTVRWMLITCFDEIPTCG